MIFQILLMLIQSKSVVVHSWDPLEWHQFYVDILLVQNSLRNDGTPASRRRWMIGLPSIVGRMSQWAGWQEFGMHGSYYLSYWKINLSWLWSLEIPSAIFAFNGVLPKRLSLQHITVNDTSHLKGKATTPCTLQSTPWHPTSPPTAPSSRHSKSTWAPLSTSLDVLTRDLVKSKWHHGGFVFATAEGPKFPFPNKRRPRFFELCQQVATGSHWMTALLRYWLVKDSRPRC